MDGTGALFKSFLQEFDTDSTATVVRYPTDQRLSYPALTELVSSSLPSSEPYVLLAESFSTPIAILCAAQPSPNLKALILCAGFSRSPAPKWLSSTVALLRPAFFLPIPDGISKLLLLGSEPHPMLLKEVRDAVARVKSGVLTHRLKTILDCDVRRELASTSVPLLYIRATEDRLIPMRSFDEIRSVRGDVSLAEVNAPHLVLQQRPRESAERAKAFIKQLA
jgi:pimeloyl-[acyl-carrier protein] methyl ester esterase